MEGCSIVSNTGWDTKIRNLLFSLFWFEQVPEICSSNSMLYHDIHWNANNKYTNPAYQQSNFCKQKLSAPPLVPIYERLEVLTSVRLTFLMPKNKNKENKKCTKTKKALLQRGLIQRGSQSIQTKQKVPDFGIPTSVKYCYLSLHCTPILLQTMKTPLYWRTSHVVYFQVVLS